MYALTENPTIYVSLIHQFWQTASASTSENGEIEITATIDGKVKTVTEASIRRHLKLEYSDGISTLPNTKFFEQLALMGNGPIYQGKGSIVPVESHHTPTVAPSTSPPHISPTLRSPIRQETEVPQLSSPPHTNVADEAASISVDVRHGGAATTVTSLDTGQGSGNINKTPSMPYDSPLPRGHTLGSDEGRMQHHKLMDLVTKLSDRSKVLADAAKNVHTYTRRRRAVSTGSGRVSTASRLFSTAEDSVSTAGASMPVSTAEGSEPTEELKADEISQEDLQQMIMVVLVEEVYVEALQKFDRDDLDKLWSLVKERFSSTDPTDDKERTLWVELKRLFKPDTDDILWKLQRYMHDPLTWRLYDTCGVHHVSTDRGHDIFMLVEKDYPLTRGLLTLMLCNKLQVDQYSEMADELLRKIVILANRPRQWSRWRIEMETTVERFASRGWRWPATAVKRLEGFLKCEGVKGYSDQICTLPGITSRRMSTRSTTNVCLGCCIKLRSQYLFCKPDKRGSCPLCRTSIYPWRRWT
ncbi:hypothetical protein Tco_1131845 [Tanacetum coccineum]|uniref:RING-type domain-containing protein n=1 Tax=Tanacetum coccineum TaxID=301880 RepID=A0ABQ5JED5_9ASTR